MKRASLLAPFVALVACGQTELPPSGEVLLVVDTDLAVPALAGRLRVDVFSEEGTWLESRDIGRSDPRDWPASFSVFSDDDTRERSALVRLRVYPEGALSPYTGEHGVQNSTFTEPPIARSVQELCENAPELPLGGSITRRLGEELLSPHVTKPSCPKEAQGGAIAARVTIGAKGTYRFSVAHAFPFFVPVALSLRSACADPTSQTTCRTEKLERGFGTTGHFPRFDAKLDPGTYWLVATSLLPDTPADITLDAYPVDAPLPADTPRVSETKASTLPRLLRDGDDRTPPTEPSATATVDRLVLVRIAPNARTTANVILRGACAGVRAQLSAKPYEVDLASAATCIEAEGLRSPLVPSPTEPGIVRRSTSMQGTFGQGEPCPPDSNDAARACIPGGVFLLGTRVLSPFAFEKVPTAPLRIAVMPRFAIDRHEVTVGRLRAAVARGFTIDPEHIKANDDRFPLPRDKANPPPIDAWCTWSSIPLDREDYPVSCISWNLARAFCRFEGGDLPTEAEWEYVATTAGRSFKSDFPWGSDAPPLCERAVVLRHNEIGRPLCGDDAGPAPISQSDGGDGRAPDGTALGVFGLAGSVQEWVMDTPAGYDSPCWTSSGLRSPRCFEEHSPWRGLRGSAWAFPPVPLVQRNAGPPLLSGYTIKEGDRILSLPDATIGFRCAYAEAR